MGFSRETLAASSLILKAVSGNEYMVKNPSIREQAQVMMSNAFSALCATLLGRTSPRRRLNLDSEKLVLNLQSV